MRKRRCDYCRRWFTPQRRHQCFCCPACRHEVRRTRRWSQRSRQRTEREHASFRASFTATPDAVCAMCGSGMHRVRSTRRYCSKKCRQTAFRQRTPTTAQIRAHIDRNMRKLERLQRAAWVRELIADAALRRKEK